MVKHTALSPRCNTELHDEKGSRAINCSVCKFAMKNAGSVHGTIEKALQQIKGDMANSCQKCHKFALCVCVISLTPDSIIAQFSSGPTDLFSQPGGIFNFLYIYQ